MRYDALLSENYDIDVMPTDIHMISVISSFSIMLIWFLIVMTNGQ